MIITLLIIGLLIYYWKTANTVITIHEEQGRPPISIDSFDKETRDVGMTLFLMGEFHDNPNADD